MRTLHNRDKLSGIKTKNLIKRIIKIIILNMKKTINKIKEKFNSF